ncbi:MAG: hypothetical protein GX085_01455 [Firmicutes bacterium]|nr:hypothetical protein [Bacillota bacterium]
MRIIKGLLLKYDGKSEAIILTKDGAFRRVKIYHPQPAGNEVYGILAEVRKKIRFGLVAVAFFLLVAVAGSFFGPVTPGGPAGAGGNPLLTCGRVWAKNTGTTLMQMRERPAVQLLYDLINPGQ